MNSSIHRHAALGARNHAFTLVELLAIVAVLVLLSSVMIRGRAGARDGSQTVQCLNNHRQLIVAWQMYADDNAGRLVHNYHGSSAQGGSVAASLSSPWALGWLDWGTSTDNTNIALLVHERYSRLAKYFNRDPRVLQCPADTYVSSVQAALGWTRRARSYSMNAALGEGNVTTGPWDPGIYKQIKRSQDLGIPGPENTFVFIEEHPDSNNDPLFQLPYVSSLMDVPANHHNGGCAVNFADGHAEVHDWEGAALEGRASRVVRTEFNVVRSPTRDPDLHWLSWHSPRLSSKSY